MTHLLILLALGWLGFYLWACVGVVVVALIVRFWWVVALGGLVAALAARVPA